MKVKDIGTQQIKINVLMMILLAETKLLSKIMQNIAIYLDKLQNTGQSL